ncbi:hypothetical protein [Tahibacter soli]|jgi:hypothetical protein|uniref:Uncharacterized protein n=1 Tax=Tahibacter soli TaxID=2983605 RepID=A0A9X4BI10_9GAMM|nr:hypothetical protein [Tahibacter soli]MDC8011757.1 hypothetical protein [Tahibacter soli]
MVSLLASLLLSGSYAANLPISASACEFGEVYQGQPAECLVEFVNLSDKPVKLSALTAKRPNDRLDVDTLVLAPKSTGHVRLHVDTSLDIGTAHHPLSLRVPGSDNPLSVNSRGFVMSVFDHGELKVDLGTVSLANGDRKPESLTVSSDEDPGAKLVRVLQAPPYLDVTLSQDGRTINVGLRDSAPWGPIDTQVVLGVDSAKQKQVAVKVVGDARGKVAPSSNPFALDLIRRGSGRHEYIIPLTDVSGEALKVGRLTLEGIEGRVRNQPCVPERKDCRWLKLEISDKQPTGRIDGKLLVQLPGYGQALPIYLWGLMVNADTKIRDGDEELRKSAEKAAAQAESAGASPVFSAAPKPGNLVDELKRATKSSSQAQIPGTGPLLRWQVANEAPLYGYVVYRAGSADGPWKRVNGETIRVVTEDNAGGSYSWRDQSAVPGEHYWYYIGTIDFRGKRERLTTPSEVVVKAAQ